MPGAEVFEISPCSFVHAGGTLALPQMNRFRCEAQGQWSRVRPGGTVHSLAHLLNQAKPRASFETGDLTTFFTTVSPVSGLKMTGDTTFRLQEREDCGIFMTGAEHVTITATKGFLWPVSITAEQDSQDGAMLQAAFLPIYDGTNMPWVVNDGVNFASAPAAAFGSQFFLGPVYHNGAEIKGVVRQNIEFGIDFQGIMQSPGAYARAGAVYDINPVLRFATKKIDATAAVNMFARAVTTGLAFYLQKGAASSDRVIPATTVHCKISCTAGAIETEDIDGQAGQDALTQFTIRPTSALSVSVASAIP